MEIDVDIHSEKSHGVDLFDDYNIIPCLSAIYVRRTKVLLYRQFSPCQLHDSQDERSTGISIVGLHHLVTQDRSFAQLERIETNMEIQK